MKKISSGYINNKDVEIAKISASLAHPVRVALLRYVLGHNAACVERSICNQDLVNLFPYSHSTMSQHVKKLKEVGFLKTRRSHKYIYYTVNKQLVKKYKQLVEGALRGSN